MSRIAAATTTGSRLRRAGRRHMDVPEVLRVRATTGVLWLLVLLGALGGVRGLLAPTGRTVVEDASAGAEEPVAGATAASGLAERFVTAYLTAGRDGEALEEFLGYGPDLAAGAVGEEPAQPAGPARTVAVEGVEDGYWAVTVAAGEPGAERFWRVGVADRGGDRSVATGLPAPVAAPLAGEPTELAVAAGDVPADDDPAVQTVAGFIGAYACGQGGLERWLRPGVELAAVSPTVCRRVELVRWGSDEITPGRQRVVADAVLEGRGPTRRVTYGLELARRDGRWEVAELLPAPPIS